ncbi:MAG TPA: class I SAM-dependent methyltransferase [Miltoncostaeaceae bacterium]|jgi:SAM-dependent methyltransferase|nr:class I SAM-dependent methyltransferase [Miltoncostaeaceae bacterium]
MTEGDTMTTDTHTGTPTMADKLRATWDAGDYAEVAERLVLPLGPVAVEAADIGAGDEVLDVAAGTGNASIPAAATGARVTGLDIAPGLLATARARAAEAGVTATFVEGDAEDLPFPDASFDVVTSTLGIQFAPHHERTAAELARVLRPGGRMALCNWTPEGYIGRFFAALSPYMPAPPAGVSPPPRWGDATHVSALFAGTGVTLAFARRTVDFRDRSPESFIDFMATCYGPLVKAREMLSADGRWDDLRADLIAVSVAMDEGTEGAFRVPSEYLVVTGRKR